MFEIIKSLMPLLLAIFFLYGASKCIATAILEKRDRKIQVSLSAVFIGVALFIWVLSMVDFFDLMGRVIYNRALAMILSICIMFLITIIMTVHSYMFEKNNT